MSDEKGIRAHLGGHLRENGMLLALLAIVAFFTILLQLREQPVNFLQPLNIANLFLQIPLILSWTMLFLRTILLTARWKL